MPAVTKVDECTRAETGVGAAMAAGSHALNGTWALFVIAAKRIKEIRVEGWYVWSFIIMLHSPEDISQVIVSTMNPSPIRLVITVSIPAASDLLL